FFQAEDGIRDRNVTGVQTCALPICRCAAGAPRPTVRARSPPASSERYRLENLETLEGERQVRLRLRYVPEFPVVEIVAHPVPPEIGRASCRKECRPRRWRQHLSNDR